jgi:subtilisin family serine protease
MYPHYFLAQLPRSLFFGLAILLALSLLPQSSIAAPPAPATPASDKIAAQVLATLDEKEQTTFWLLLPGPENIGQAARIRDWNARGQAVYQQLRATADTSQAGIIALLEARGAKYQTFWLVNTIQVTGGISLLNELSARPEVVQVLADQTYQIPQPKPSVKRANPETVEDIEWNIAHIRAPEVWSGFATRGEGIVVANIDGGVDYTHPALATQYRGNLGGGIYDHNYNWFDPTYECNDPFQVPCDFDGHGTHTMGTIAGSEGDAGPNQIGVAPRARWIAAKGCGYYYCTETDLLAAAQWILAPTDLSGQNPQPSMRPHIVNNSWGGPSNDPFFRSIIQAWEAAGIFNTFSIGNSGDYGCQTAGSPGDYPESYGVGAFDRGNRIADFSSRGASQVDQSIKPNIAAPGVDVRSSVPGPGYEAHDGTSMAAPHVAGVVALMWSAAPVLVGDIAETRAILNQSAIDVEDLSCGGSPSNNNVWGEGRLDAFAAVELSPKGPSGILQGVAAPPYATIKTAGPINRTIVTNGQGAYSVRLPIGSYSVTASLFGYISQSTENVTISQDTTTLQNFQLLPAPAHSLSGHVLDSNGEPVTNASVRILNTPIPPALTDASGFYTFASVPDSTYEIRAEAGGCNGPQTINLTLNQEQVLDFSLPKKTDAAGYTCRLIEPAYIEATTILADYGDDRYEPVELPFPFVFYGNVYENAYICSNGSLNFYPICRLSNTSIPGSSPSAPAIHALWDDLVIYGGGSIRSELLGESPNRRFVVEWRNVGFFRDYSEQMRVDFEVILFENGLIQTHYRNIEPVGMEMGDRASVGIESGKVGIGLGYSYNTPSIASPNFALSYAPPPGATVTGRVTSNSAGGSVANAQVRALQGLTETLQISTGPSGVYQMRLPLGTYTLEAGAYHYTTQTSQITLATIDELVTQDFGLDSARMDASPSSMQITMTQGQLRTELLTLRNTGTTDLVWEIRESKLTSRTAGRSQSLWPGFQREPSWISPPLPAGLIESLPTVSQNSDNQNIARLNNNPGPLDTIMVDPMGDANGLDIMTVRGAVADIGMITLSIDVTGTLSPRSVYGYILLDTDQNQATGDSAEEWFGLPAQTVGADYVLDIFYSPLGLIYSTETGDIVGAVSARFEGQTIFFDIPVISLGNDDGALDMAMVLGSGYGPADWAPNSGHGSLFPRWDIPWLTAQPSTGTLPAGSIQAIELTIDGRTPEFQQAAIQSAGLAVIGNDPATPAISVPISVQVATTLSTPKLAIGTAATHYSGTVALPISLVESQSGVTGVDFALSLADQCLDVSPDDKDNDGIPDAVVFVPSDGYSQTVSLDADANGRRLRFHIEDPTAPFTTLPKGELLSVNFTATCQPAWGGHILASVDFRTDPPLIFKDSNGQPIPGEGLDGSVTILWGTPGDGNGDGRVDSADVAAAVQEIFDGDGTFWLDVPGGGVVGNPVGADANQDTLVDAADAICSALISDGGGAACPASLDSQRELAATTLLTITQKIPASLDQRLDVPIFFHSNGNPTSGLAFTLNFDDSWLTFDPADGNNDGIPDAITFALSDSFALSVTHRAGEGGISFFVGDVAPPLALLPDGPIATVTFLVQVNPAALQAQESRIYAAAPDGVQLTARDSSDFRKRETLLHFALNPSVSTASSSGQSLPVQPQDGSVLITLREVFLPWMAQ